LELLADFVADVAVGRVEPRERVRVLVNLGERKLIFAERPQSQRWTQRNAA